MTTTANDTAWEVYYVLNGRPQTRRQIGWYVVAEAMDVPWYGEYAADYGTVTVPPGKYPVYALRDCGQPWHSLSITMPGTVKAGSWWNSIKPGESRDAHVSPYPHTVAAAIVEGVETPIELFPEVEAKRVDFVSYDGKRCHTHELFVDGESI